MFCWMRTIKLPNPHHSPCNFAYIKEERLKIKTDEKKGKKKRERKEGEKISRYNHLIGPNTTISLPRVLHKNNELSKSSR